MDVREGHERDGAAVRAAAAGQGARAGARSLCVSLFPTPGVTSRDGGRL